MNDQPQFIPLPGYKRFSPDEMNRRAANFYSEVRRRRTVREFSDEPVPYDIISTCIRTAGSAPSGANMQPWHFVVISDPSVKEQIRTAAEEEEKEFYENRASTEWLKALEPIGTDEKKPFLEAAPYLIAIFTESYGVKKDGEKYKHYYVKESVGIATGILITALHHAGLATLTHTPSPMGFLNDILNRPENETPFLLLVTGYPAEAARVPDISKKPLDEICTHI